MGDYYEDESEYAGEGEEEEEVIENTDEATVIIDDIEAPGTYHEKIRIGTNRVSIPYVNAFIYSKIISTRVKQLDRGEKCLLPNDMPSSHELVDIAKQELLGKYLDNIVTIRIPRPDGFTDQFKLSEMEFIFRE